jgi:hypothetical protein
VTAKPQGPSFVFSQNESVVLEAITAAKSLHLIVPLIISIEYRLDEMGLSVSDVQKESIVL